jgi:hypothetical protein
MKKYFSILFISITVIFSFGFRGCEHGICIFFRDLNYLAFSNIGPIASGDSLYRLNLIDCVDLVSLGTDKYAEYIKGYDLTGDEDIDLMCSVGHSGLVVWSPDGGYTWEDHSIPGMTENLYGLDYYWVPQGVGVVVCGDSGIVYKSSDTGLTWEQVNTITQNKLTSIAAYGNDFFIAVGENGTIIKGSGATGWEDKSVDPSVNFNCILLGVSVSAFDWAWAVADNGKIYATTNYGNTWIPRPSGTFENLHDIKFRNENEGIVVGDNGVVRYTNNGGVTWQEDSYFSGLTSGDILSVATVDFNTGMALVRNTNLDGGSTTSMLVVSSEPLAVDETGNIIPSEYSLEQNYPNPFNPSTKIEYKILHPGFVSLKVYDMLGNEITTLVNEEKNAGSFEINFDASNLSSGVYYYCLKAGNFTQTKKLVLMK